MKKIELQIVDGNPQDTVEGTKEITVITEDCRVLISVIPRMLGYEAGAGGLSLDIATEIGEGWTSRLTINIPDEDEISKGDIEVINHDS